MKKVLKVSRRGFLKAGGAASMAAAAAASFPGLVSATTPSSPPFAPGPGNKWPGRIATNYNSALRSYTGVARDPWFPGTADEQATIKKMTDDTIMLLTGKSTVAEAWRSIFPDTINANSKIGFKVNTNSPYVTSDVHMLQAIIAGLVSMNVGTPQNPAYLSKSNMTFWTSTNIYDNTAPAQETIDLETNHFMNRGLTATNLPGVNLVPVTSTHMHTGADAGACNYIGVPSSYSDALYESDFIINFPTIRGHSVAQLTMGFKSHFGSYNPSVNGWNGHWCYKDMCAIINSTGPVYKKTVLTVFCAFCGTMDKEAGYVSTFYNYARSKDPSVTDTKTMCNTLFMSTDPVTAEEWAYQVRSQADGGCYVDPGYLALCSGAPGAPYYIGIRDLDKMTVGEIINGVITKPIIPEVLTCLYVTLDSVSANGTYQFRAYDEDQLQALMNFTGTVDWSVDGGGSISSSGLFTSNGKLGTFTVTAALHSTPVDQGYRNLQSGGLGQHYPGPATNPAKRNRSICRNWMGSIRPAPCHRTY